MADWISSNPSQLINDANQFVAALNNPGGLAASGLTAGDMTELQDLAADLQVGIEGEEDAEGALNAARAVRRNAQAALEASLRAKGRSATNHVDMTDPLRAAAGLTVRDTEPTPGTPHVVDDLAVVGHPNGNNALDWSAPPSAEDTIWEVEMSMGSSGAWNVIGAVSKTKFLHEEAGAGVHRLYRIVARKGDIRGEPGNEAAVYGS